MAIFVLIGMLFMDIFKLSVSAAAAAAAASEFCEWVHGGIDVYIPLVKYQVFQQLFHFFHLYQRSNFSESKIKSRQPVIIAKGFWKLAYATKTKESITSQKLGSQELLILLSAKVNLLYLLYSVAQRCCRLHLIKQNWLVKISSRIVIL